MEPAQEVIRIRGVNHPINMPTSLSVALEVYNYAVSMMGDPIGWPRGAAAMVVVCCPSLAPTGWKWAPRQADALAEQALNALLMAGVSPQALLDMVRATALLKRLGELMPVFEDEASEATKNSSPPAAQTS